MFMTRRKIIGLSKDIFYSLTKYFQLKHYFCQIKQNPPQKVIYTCLTGDYDCLLINVWLNPEYLYVCFTDNAKYLKRKVVGPWQIKPLIYSKADATRNSRWHKTHPHELFPEYETSIFIDANVLFKSSKLFDTTEKMPKDIFLAIPPHKRCHCIYDELQACLQTKKDDEATLLRHQEFLLKEGFPKNLGMTENNIIFRRHNHPLCIKIMNEWWNMINQYSKRDQLSLFYILWKNNLQITYLFESAIKNDKQNFRIFHHNKH